MTHAKSYLVFSLVVWLLGLGWAAFEISTRPGQSRGLTGALNWLIVTACVMALIRTTRTIRRLGR